MEHSLSKRDNTSTFENKLTTEENTPKNKRKSFVDIFVNIRNQRKNIREESKIDEENIQIRRERCTSMPKFQMLYEEEVITTTFRVQERRSFVNTFAEIRDAKMNSQETRIEKQSSNEAQRKSKVIHASKQERKNNQWKKPRVPGPNVHREAKRKNPTAKSEVPKSQQKLFETWKKYGKYAHFDKYIIDKEEDWRSWRYLVSLRERLKASDHFIKPEDGDPDLDLTALRKQLKLWVESHQDCHRDKLHEKGKCYHDPCTRHHLYDDPCTRHHLPGGSYGCTNCCVRPEHHGECTFQFLKDLAPHCLYCEQDCKYTRCKCRVKPLWWERDLPSHLKFNWEKAYAERGLKKEQKRMRRWIGKFVLNDFISEVCDTAERQAAERRRQCQSVMADLIFGVERRQIQKVMDKLVLEVENKVKAEQEAEVVAKAKAEAEAQARAKALEEQKLREKAAAESATEESNPYEDEDFLDGSLQKSDEDGKAEPATEEHNLYEDDDFYDGSHHRNEEDGKNEHLTKAEMADIEADVSCKQLLVANRSELYNIFSCYMDKPRKAILRSKAHLFSLHFELVPGLIAKIKLDKLIDELVQILNEDPDREGDVIDSKEAPLTYISFLKMLVLLARELINKKPGFETASISLNEILKFMDRSGGKQKMGGDLSRNSYSSGDMVYLDSPKLPDQDTAKNFGLKQWLLDTHVQKKKSLDESITSETPYGEDFDAGSDASKGAAAHDFELDDHEGTTLKKDKRHKKKPAPRDTGDEDVKHSNGKTSKKRDKKGRKGRAHKSSRSGLASLSDMPGLPGQEENNEDQSVKSMESLDDELGSMFSDGNGKKKKNKHKKKDKGSSALSNLSGIPGLPGQEELDGVEEGMNGQRQTRVSSGKKHKDKKKKGKSGKKKKKKPKEDLTNEKADDTFMDEMDAMFGNL